jgi:hypothetical protein
MTPTEKRARRPATKQTGRPLDAADVEALEEIRQLRVHEANEADPAS